MRAGILVLSLLLPLSTFAKQPARDTLTRDSQRRANLQASAEAWFRAQVLPQALMALDAITGSGVSVTEPRVILPPDLGGPKDMVEVTVDANFSGWTVDRGYNRHRFSSCPESGFAECRFEQKLWAQIDAQGRPVRLMPGQSARSLIACMSGSLEHWRDRHPYQPPSPN